MESWTAAQVRSFKFSLVKARRPSKPKPPESARPGHGPDSKSGVSGKRNTLSNSPCPLGRARRRCRYNLLARAINKKPFQCSDGRNSPERRRSAARVEQGDLFKFYARSRSLISAQFWSRFPAAAPRSRAGRTRGFVQILRSLTLAHLCSPLVRRAANDSDSQRFGPCGGQAAPGSKRDSGSERMVQLRVEARPRAGSGGAGPNRSTGTKLKEPSSGRLRLESLGKQRLQSNMTCTKLNSRGGGRA